MAPVSHNVPLLNIIVFICKEIQVYSEKRKKLYYYLVFIFPREIQTINSNKGYDSYADDKNNNNNIYLYSTVSIKSKSALQNYKYNKNNK
jgi:hypothetical protein